MRVIPTFCAITPERMASSFAALSRSELDLDVDAGGEVELHQRVHRLGRRVHDVEQPLVGPHFELLATLLVDMGRAIDGELLDLGRQRDRPAHLRAGPLGGRDDLAGRRIENAMIERLEPNSDVLTVHCSCGGQTTDDGPLGSCPDRLRAPFPVPRCPSVVSRPCSAVRHSMIEVTTPEPTVRPPSRMAKRSFSSMAIGTISSIVMAVLSPGITISVPSGRCTTPVTSVVRK